MKPKPTKKKKQRASGGGRKSVLKSILNEKLLVNGKSGVYILDGRKSNLNLQQPALFDFSRRDRQFELLDVILK